MSSINKVMPLDLLERFIQTSRIVQGRKYLKT